MIRAPISDTQIPTEITRLMREHRLMVEGMHGLFPERTSLENIQAILDIGTGSGGWVLDVAHTYPDRRVIGVDINKAMITYAQAQAIAGWLSNAVFVVMDALGPLSFVEGTFDLVNVRAATHFIPRAQWSTLLQRCSRVMRPSGIIRITECEMARLTSSPAVEQMHSWAAQMLWERGYGFERSGSHLNILSWLNLLLVQMGYGNFQFKHHVLDFSSGTAGHSDQYQNYKLWPQLIKSAIIDQCVTTEELFDQTYQQMLEEMRLPQFRGQWNLLTVWAEKQTEEGALKMGEYHTGKSDTDDTLCRLNRRDFSYVNMQASHLVE